MSANSPFLWHAIIHCVPGYKIPFIPYGRWLEVLLRFGKNSGSLSYKDYAATEGSAIHRWGSSRATRVVDSNNMIQGPVAQAALCCLFSGPALAAVAGSEHTPDLV